MIESVDFRVVTESMPALIKKGGTYYLSADRTCLFTGEDTFNNTDEFLICNARKFGGTIVNFKEDITVIDFRKLPDLEFGKRFIEGICALLISKGLNTVISNNDILVNGYKVASRASQIEGNSCVTAIHISMYIDIDLIKRVCTKEMIKIPKGLLEFGIKREELIDYIENNLV